MRTIFMAAVLATAVSAGAMAYAQVAEPTPSMAPTMSSPIPMSAPDARSLASDSDVGQARRYYRAQCNRHESREFCECVTAGVAQALMPQEVRIAGRTIGQRITAQGDAGVASDSDASSTPMNSAERIAQVEGHYADACAQYRGSQ